MRSLTKNNIFIPKAFGLWCKAFKDLFDKELEDKVKKNVWFIKHRIIALQQLTTIIYFTSPNFLADYGYQVVKPRQWATWIFHGLIFREHEEESILKAVDLVITKTTYQDTVIHLKTLKELDQQNVAFYVTFEKKLKSKFESNN